MDLDERILELNGYGYGCGQSMAILLLDTLGEENPGLVRSLQGLNGGVGGSKRVCGCMTAGCCMLSYCTGKPDDTGTEHPRHKEVLGAFTQWFEEEIGGEYGSVDCSGIVGDDPTNKVKDCPQILAAAYEKCVELLEEAGLL